MAGSIAPVDTSVSLPPSVLAAGAAADAAHKAAYNTPDPAPLDPVTPPPAPVETTPPAVAAPDATAPVALSRPEDRSGVDPATAEGRYFAMEGRYRQSQQTIGALQEQMREMGDELMRATQALQQAPARTQPVRQNAPAAPAFVTDEDVKTFGPELIDVVKRAAREAIAPDLAQVTQQTRQVSQRVAGNAQDSMIQNLDQQVPNWRQIDLDPRFKSWASSRDVYSGQVRGQLLNAAFKAADAPRVVAFFKGFLAEEVATGNAPSPQPEPAPQPPRQAAVALETLTAPGRPKPAAGNAALPADKPVFTRAQIASFYTQVRQGAYSGRDADKAKDEQAIFAAQRDGRVRG